MEWQLKKFHELTTDELYKILKARVDVFVVEQNCPYEEVDNHDQASFHLFSEENGQIIAYSRLIPKGNIYKEASIGRVLVHKDYRGKGYAKALMEKSIDIVTNEWNEKEIKIHGQEYLRHFYGSLGFKEISEVYLEDDIPHVDMILQVT
ncbi:GNAT family N-acetyltransferase [Aquibacillus koreensis]|uniref:Protein ElaA n=1 Tax=Aquibacillus koreensis TaxID=279446 RepID=A0A9X4AJU2_9BACI|nr:GNAT family N-acetyltransferase [Aquibacillus koreensis]MCT2534922.1 GNAT family N-acetyltransferase [Aquibacillus koreensis]MDC3422184.1 GNAT family N-acetyltransferase [Aquibacillus koreensis]